ncbi:MAG: UvrD-helicase domain-containing protein [Treponema sp.]|nr:UvrD-helicase domain-containing protein [Treponema sp.]
MKKKYPYLYELSRKLDDAQSEVCCRISNTVVGAGAGSGKTQTLATRFAWLVMSENISAKEILTLTFTNKAASEMYERIYETLYFFVYECTNVPLKEKERAKIALNEFSQVHIQTLDSYCNSILKQCTNRYGIKADFVSGDLSFSEQIEKQALEFVIKHRNSVAIQYFSEAGKLQDFSKTVFAQNIINNTSLASEKEFFSKMLLIQTNIIREFFKEKKILSYINVAKENLQIYYSSVDSKMNSYKVALDLNEQLTEMKNQIEKQFSQLININPKNDYEKVKECINNIFIHIDYINSNKSKLRKNQKTCESNVDLNSKIDEIKKVFEFFLEVFKPQLNGIISYCENYKYIEELYGLLDIFLEQVNSTKRITGNLSFNDVSEMALKILIEQKDIRQQEKKSFNKIMIDEFQDNNGKNRDLLFLLSEKDDICVDGIPKKDEIKEDKLFFVGDEKQSIYKFRGADVSVFNKLKIDLGEDNFLQMTYNYRSVNELVSSFNKLFGGFNGVFKTNILIEPDELYEASYAKDAVPIEKPSYKPTECVILSESNVKSHVRIVNTKIIDENNKLPFDNPERKNFIDSDDQVAFYIAKKIKTIYEEMNKDERKYSDFAILDLNRTSRIQLTRWLNRFGIPYDLDLNTDIFQDAPTNDIYNFLRLCVYPMDLKSFAVVLSSPFVGLTQSSLQTVLAIMLIDENEIEVFSERYDEQIKNELSDDEFRKYKNGAKLFNSEKELTLKRPLTETVSFLWYKCGYYFETLLDEKTNLYAEQFDMLFELARMNDEIGSNIGIFIDTLASEEKEMTKEISFPKEKRDAVQVMTIHKSKGLEFDYVFIMRCMGLKPRNASSSCYYEEHSGLSLKTKGEENFFYVLNKELNAKKTKAEFRRAIYVGITRAIKEYFIVNSWNPTQDLEKSSSKNLILEPIIQYYYPECLMDVNYAYDKKVFEKNAPFDYKSIKLQEIDVYQNIEKSNSDENLTQAEKRKKIIDGAEIFYENADVKTEVSKTFQKISPSSLELNNHESEKNAGDKFEKINYIFKKEIFEHKDFGTLVHVNIENFINTSVIKFISTKKFTKLSAKEQNEISHVCIDVVKQFSESKIGKQFLKCKEQGKLFKSEYGFKMFENDSIITGNIDLVYENENGTYVIVDYKTDTTLNYEKYIPQQICYKNAIKEIFKIDEKKIKCVLYYVRFDSIHELSI